MFYSLLPHSTPYAARPNRRGDNWNERTRIHVTLPLRRDRSAAERGGAGTSQDGTSKNWFKITVSIVRSPWSRGARGLGSQLRCSPLALQNQLFTPQSGNRACSESHSGAMTCRISCRKGSRREKEKRQEQHVTK